MKNSVLILLMLACGSFLYAQNTKIDSLDRLIVKATSDTQRINLNVEKIGAFIDSNIDSALVLGNKIVQEAHAIKFIHGEAMARIQLAFAYCYKGEYDTAKNNLEITQAILSGTKDSVTIAKMYDGFSIMYSMQSKYDSALVFSNKAIALAELLNNPHLTSTVALNMAIVYQQLSNYPQALTYYQKALTSAEKEKDEVNEAYICLNMAIAFNLMEDYARAEQFYLRSTSLAKKLNLKLVEAYAYSNLAALYSDLNKPKEQYDYSMMAAELAKLAGDPGIEGSSLSRAATALAKQGKFDEAEQLNHRAIRIADSANIPLTVYQTYTDMGLVLRLQKKYARAITYYESAFKSMADVNIYDPEVATTYFSLSECYEGTGNYSKALEAYKTYSKISDSLRNKANIRKATELTLNYEFNKKQQLAKAEQDKKDAESKRIKNQQYFIIIALGIIVLAGVFIASIQFKNSRHRQKAYDLLQEQKKETDDQKHKVEETLSELKATQKQLIQSEKMASLGELTAGIAHEIQNPLNFVKNFSEVSNEMIDEMKEELTAGNLELVTGIADDIKLNLEKIKHHGKRADSIVKGMLQHSRTSSGQKELTDINALCDEYVRLSYHGLRAKDKSFTADFKTHFDESIEKINIIPQDIGRVLLNLINNAFYAGNEKLHTASSTYIPTVTLVTKKLSNKIEIQVKDNANGIPQNIIEKIFQPFFTTKPTGQGTGLGLSLSYDIIKAHGGDIKVETKEGEGTTFIIQLPFNP